MTIKRYVAEKDTTITNAYKNDNITRATKSNMGASDILEIFSIYAQVSETSSEKSRILVQFPISNILSDRNNKVIADSGSCQFILKLSNASHSQETPENITVSVFPLSRSWTEGYGLDMEQYLDIGPANWISASSTQGWTIEGGDYLQNEETISTIQLSTDDLEVDVTNIVEKWINSEITNNGFLICLSSSLENDNQSYYTKKFFARRSQFFYKRPWIEVRSNSSIKDKRNSFYMSSELVSAQDNLNTLFLYNNIRGQLKNIPTVGTGTLLVSMYSGTVDDGPSGLPLALLNGSTTTVTGGYYTTGVYTASIGISGSYSYLYDVWRTLGGTELHTGSLIYTKTQDASDDFSIPEYILSMPQLKQNYRNSDNVRLRVEIKNRNWDSNLYHVAYYEPDTTIIENLYYKIIRIADGYEVIPYGTGSFKHTLTSYDNIGNYFDFDMNLLEPEYSYKLFFGFEYNGEFYELKDTFKFRVHK
jgi:hypothetical protein